MARRLRPIWQAFEEAGREVTTEAGNDFMVALSQLETAISRESMFERISAKLLRDKGENNRG